MFQPNLNKTDRWFRLLLAFWWLGPLAPDYPYVWMNWAIFILGWIALLEAFIGYCAFMHVCGIKTKE
ncbi:DUF2892 domain-containing protein [Candidatus Woesearchaeota archaeon]|nr:DUF2892 domain-containing protein [Candidatus Woesearchaeota archaeon]